MLGQATDEASLSAFQAQALRSHDECFSDAAARLAPSPLEDEQVYTAALYLCSEERAKYRALKRGTSKSDADAGNAQLQASTTHRRQFLTGLAAIRKHLRDNPEPEVTDR